MIVSAFVGTYFAMADDPKQPPQTEKSPEPSPAGAASDSARHADSDGSRRAHQKKERRAILSDILFGLLTAVLLIFAKEYFDGNTKAGEQLELATYGWLQQRLAAAEPDAQLPIVIVDLSDLKTTAVEGARKGEEATPRKPLEDLLSTLIVNQGAYAAGLDVDFSPEQGGRLPVTRDDFHFFDFCLKLRDDSHRKVYLGVYRTVLLARKNWLGPEQYQQLAASILAPREEVTRMVNCIAVNGAPTCQGDSLAALLATEMQNLNEQKSSAPAETHLAERFPLVFERISPHQLTDDVSVKLFPVDYSQLKTLMSREHTFPTSDPKIMAGFGDFFRNKIVLLGDANPDTSADKFIVPGEHEPIPGIYIHASAIYTLSQAPLYQLSWRGRWFVDLLLAVVVIGTISSIRWYYIGRTTREFAHHKVEGFLIFLVVIVTIVVAAGLVHRHRVLWTDFVLAIFALLLHPMGEKYTKGLSTWLGKAVPSVWRRAVFEDAKEEHAP
jgi:CHASE2 domain-containing sensor protein